MDFLTLLGTTGATLVLIAFVMLQLKKWKHEDFIYDFINFLGALILVIYALILESWPFAVLNLVWTGVSLRDLYLYFKKHA